MAKDWSLVLRSHVEQACQCLDRGSAVPTHKNVQTFLVLNDRRYPAKIIRGLAYQIATGVSIGRDEFSGGAETSRFFSRLGLKTESVTGTVTPPEVPARSLERSSSTKLRLNPRSQKEALRQLLSKRFSDLTLETKFPWLVVPAVQDMDPLLGQIFRALATSRGHTAFASAGRSLCCDFSSVEGRIIIEYDEFQHFTDHRAIALHLYPPDLACRFDRDRWIATCAKLRSADNDPPYRDEQRAFYDTMRDVCACRNGFTLVRIQHGDFDWTADDACKHLDVILPTTMQNPSIQPLRVAERSTVIKSGVDGQTLRKVALVTHNYKCRDSASRWDFSEHFDQINRICDEAGCDTILYALFTWDARSSVPKSHDAIFCALRSVERIMLEVGDLSLNGGNPKLEELNNEFWIRGREAPLNLAQRFSRSGEAVQRGAALMADLEERRVGNVLPLICGETNVVSIVRKTRQIYDPLGIGKVLQELGIRIVLNPIHDFMRRYEMRLKRKYLSEGGRTVFSVWNQGRGRESQTPWTVFHNGAEETQRVKEISRPFSERPDIRIGVFDLENFSD